MPSGLCSGDRVRRPAAADIEAKHEMYVLVLAMLRGNPRHLGFDWRVFGFTAFIAVAPIGPLPPNSTGASARFINASLAEVGVSVEENCPAIQHGYSHGFEEILSNGIECLLPTVLRESSADHRG
jgi:hypothetical protein